MEITASSNNLSALLSLLALVLGLFCLWQIYSINKLKSLFFSGRKGMDLEEVILNLKNELKDAQGRINFLEQTLSDLKNNFGFAIQKVGLVRFNPFNDGGGNFSFCLALLDGHNSGVLITSMYGREQNRIYTKKINQGNCENPLTEEETKAIQLADS